MKALTHVSGQAFVLIVGIAALIHSSWTVSTFTGGDGPQIVITDPGAAFWSVLAWLWWLLPGFLGAFALEVGQVVTARHIQAGVGRRIRIGRLSINVKILTFILMSAGTYLLQLIYLLHHYPLRQLSPGLPESEVAAGQFVMRIMIWGGPILLPGTMLFATASDEATERQPYPLMSPTGLIAAKCPECNWCKEYPDTLSAQNALNGHMRAHNLLGVASTNGKH